MTFEFAILDWFQQLHSTALTYIMRFFTTIGDNGYVWIALGVVLLCIPKTRRLGLAFTLSLVIEALLCNIILKPIIARGRPCWAIDVNTIIANPKDYSFPSGHSGASFVSATVMLRHNKKAGIICFVIATIIALSRLYFYVHFPTDVAAGIILGIICGIFGDKLMSFILKKMDAKKAIKKDAQD